MWILQSALQRTDHTLLSLCNEFPPSEAAALSARSPVSWLLADAPVGRVTATASAAAKKRQSGLCRVAAQSEDAGRTKVSSFSETQNKTKQKLLRLKSNSVVWDQPLYSTGTVSLLYLSLNSRELQYYLTPRPTPQPSPSKSLQSPNIPSRGQMVYLCPVPSKCSSQKYLYVLYVVLFFLFFFVC